jgi:ferredoxin
MQARVRRERCISCGCCEDICPEVFDLEDGRAAVRTPEVGPMDEGFCIDAMWTCPRAAIQLRDLAGDLFPEWTSAEHGAASALGLPPRSLMVAACSAGRIRARAPEPQAAGAAGD